MALSDRLANSLGLDAFDRRHKYSLTVLVVAIIAVLVLWVIELRRDIVEPLYAQPQNQQTNQVSTQAEEDAAALRVKDTDTDGLNDYDELNLYKTSPYLTDSDSDGFTDKQEIDSGNDPNCPTGQVCAGGGEQGSGTAEPSDFSNPQLDALLNANISATATPTVTSTATPGTGLTVEQKTALRQAVGNTNDPVVIRQFLSQAGLPQTTLDSLTDAQVVATFNEMIR